MAARSGALQIALIATVGIAANASCDSARARGDHAARAAYSPAALARVAELRARFRAGPTSPRSVIGVSPATGFRIARPGRVRPMLPDTARRAVSKNADVELPARADGAVRIEDEASHVAVAFALCGARGVPMLAAGGIALYAGGLGGADVVYRPSAEGTEDYVVFERAPAREELVYDVDVSRVAGLRLVANTLELLDADGTPRLRVAPPAVTDALGHRFLARLSVDGCAFDASPRGPWLRAVTPPGRTGCGVRVAWHGVTYPAIVDPAWTTTGSMATPRVRHAAAVLASGRVLVAGGWSAYDHETASAEVYDPATGTFAATGSLGEPRMFLTASLLDSGLVLVAGGYRSKVEVADAELYDPASGTFAPTGFLLTSRSRHTASVLGSGKVLIAGGHDFYLGVLAEAEIYDPAVGAFSTTGAMTVPRNDHTASVLPSGKVLVAGGFGSSSEESSAELYDPSTGTFSATGSMSKARGAYTATVLGSGLVLVAGGYGALSSAELYDPASGVFTPAGSMLVGREYHTASLLGSGLVLMAGGNATGATASAEIYNPATGAFAATASMTSPREEHTASVLPSGKVLLAGGFDALGIASSAELFDADAIGGDGEPCSSPGDCASGFCVDGVCCDVACNGQCEACDGLTMPGTCTAVTGVPHGTRTPCAGAGNDCGSSCDGADRQQCTFVASGAACGSASCTNGTEQRFVCDGQGACTAQTPVACAPYVCGASACNSSCQVASDCAAGHDCLAGTCVTTGTGGAAGATGSAGGAGETGTAGTTGAAGVAGSGGAAGSAGAAASGGASGSAGAAGAAGSAESPSSSSGANTASGGGCSCDAAGRRATGGWAALVLLALVGTGRRRR